MGKEKTHSELIKEIIDYLLSIGIFAWPNRTRVVRKGRALIMYGYPGSTDILAVVPPDGRIICIEVKVGNDTLKDNQIKFAKDIMKRGGHWIEARSLESVVKYMENIMLDKVKA